MKHRTVILTVLITLASTFFVLPRIAASAAASVAGAQAQPQASPRPQQRRRRGRQTRRRAPGATTPSARERRNYGVFTHTSATHKGLKCSECHTVPTPNWPSARGKGAAFPDVTDYPDHPACIRCHQQQFFVGAKPVICSVCHVNVSPRDGRRFPFQNPPEHFDGMKIKKRDTSEFSIFFPHDTHQNVMARLVEPTFRGREGFAFVNAAYRQDDRAPDSCTICHKTYVHPNAVENDKDFVVPPPGDLKVPNPKIGTKEFWLKVGTFKTSPTSHDSCFSCHWKDGGDPPLSSNCNGCHQFIEPNQNTLGIRENPDACEKLDNETDEQRLKRCKEFGKRMGILDPLIMDKWLRRKSATFRHDHPRHQSVGCTACHVNITAIKKLELRTLDVPLLTCGGTGTGCHIQEKRPKGILNLEVPERVKDSNFNCIKCHINFGRPGPLPTLHRSAGSSPTPAPTPTPTPAATPEPSPAPTPTPLRLLILR